MAAAAGVPAQIQLRLEGAPVDEGQPGPAVLTLGDAVQRALTTDPGIQAALSRVRISMADARQARLLSNPVLDLVLRFGAGRPQVEVSLAQQFVQILQTPRRVSAADNRLRQTAADAVTVALDVVAEVQERYAAVQSRDRLIPLLRERLALVTKLADTAQARLAAGEGTRTDATILNAQRVELEVEISAAVLARDEERIRLARLLGEPSGPAAWALEPWVAPAISAASESAWVDVALASRPEVQSVMWQLAALGDDSALARLLPWEGAAAGVEAQRDAEWSAGPSISTPLPIFDTGAARRARASAEQVEARHHLTLARRRVVEEVRIAYQTFNAGRAVLTRIQSELLPLQQDRRQITEDVYLVERDIKPLLLAEHDLRTAQARAIEAERQVTIALIRLQRAVGGPGVARAVGQSPVPDVPSANVHEGTP